MKKYKKHIISLIIILIMLIFALSTSRSVYGELTVINNTEKKLKFKVIRYDYSSDNEFIEEFALQAGQNINLKTFHGRNTFANNGLGIISFIIYNEDNEIIKEYDNIHYENIPELNFYFKRKEKGIYYYVFNTTDELLK
jgi:hypothetical protein